MQNETAREAEPKGEPVKPSNYDDLFTRLKSNKEPPQSRAEWESRGRRPGR